MKDIKEKYNLDEEATNKILKWTEKNDEELDETERSKYRSLLTDSERMKKEVNTPAMQEFFNLIEDFDSQDDGQAKRYRKAARHLEDALLLRPLRHDVDKTTNKFKLFCYYLQVHKNWQRFLYFLSYVFIFLIFIEPSSSFSGRVQDSWYSV